MVDEEGTDVINPGDTILPFFKFVVGNLKQFQYPANKLEPIYTGRSTKRIAKMTWCNQWGCKLAAVEMTQSELA